MSGKSLAIDKPRILDLFCGAGGVAKGLQRAGFHVTGVDHQPQPRYCGDLFIQNDVFVMRPERLRKIYQAVWASPPCQGYSRMSGCRDGLAGKYPKWISETRDFLNRIGLPWVIENVEGAPLDRPIMLCGAMFGLETYRHRLFESSAALVMPPHPKHVTPTSKAGHWKPGTFVSVAGHCAPMDKCRAAMGIDWMNREELAEAIPPAYSEFIGKQLIARVFKP